MTQTAVSTLHEARDEACLVDTSVLLFLKGDGPGGVERIALRLADGWHQAGLATHILFATPAQARPAGTRLAPGWPMVRLFFAVLREIRRNRNVLLFCPGNSYTAIVVGLKLLLGRRCPPVLAKISNDLTRRDMPAMVRYPYRAWLWLQGRLIDQFAVLSAPMAQDVRAMMRCPAHRIHIVPNPVLSRHDMDGAARWHDCDRAGRRFVAVGRLERQKDYPVMLRAFAVGARPDDRLTIYGEGRAHASLAALASALGIASRVTFAGYCTDVRARLADHDVLLLSSRYEGLPGAIIEALSAGLGIVATQCCSGMADLLDDGALGALVEPGDMHGFARAIAQAVPGQPDPARARMKASAFTIEAAVPAYAALFASMRQDRQARRADARAPFPTQIARPA